MPSPIILAYNVGDSLSSLNSITIGAGVSWGTVTLPFTPLEFTREHIATVFGADFAAQMNHIDNHDFFETRYSGLPLRYQQVFWGRTRTRTKPVRGFAMGFSEGGVLSAVSDTIEEVFARQFLVRWIHSLLSSVGLDATQTSQSLDATLYGLNGNDCYQFDINAFDSNNINVCFIQVSFGAIAQAAINLLVVGPFGSGLHGGGLLNYLRDVRNRAYAWAVIGDAAAGLIMPGAQFAIISS